MWDKLDREYSEQLREENLDAMQQMYDEEVAKKSYYIASCSCGRDSIAMVLMLILRKYPLNEIVFYTNGMDFEPIYRNWEKIRKLAAEKGIKCTTLKSSKPFLYSVFEGPHKGKHDGIIRYGYGWCGGFCRWGTHEKLVVLDKHCEAREAFVYIGIAADEVHRIPDKPYKIHPLKTWGMTESDCLAFARENGFDWEIKSRDGLATVDLYDILDRVSCWCCANKNQWELYNIWYYLPDYWAALKEMQEKIGTPFKRGKYGYTIHQIEERFKNGYVPKHRAKSKNRKK